MILYYVLGSPKVRVLNMNKTLSPRTEKILKSIIEQYIARRRRCRRKSVLHNNGWMSLCNYTQ